MNSTALSAFGSSEDINAKDPLLACLALLADEPSGNLDAGNAAALHDLLRQAVVEWGVGAIVVTHSERLAALADRRVHLVAGTISE